jgi:hypothetical protein
MIEFDDKSYIVGFWYADDPVTNNNWLCCVQRDKNNPNRYEGTYRFRYNEDDKIFDSKDRKSWVSFASNKDETEEEVIETINKLQSFIAIKFPLTDFLSVRGNVEKFLEVAPSKEWMHMKEEPMEKHKK